MNRSDSNGAAVVPLARLLQQAARELQAQPPPPLPAAVLAAIPAAAGSLPRVPVAPRAGGWRAALAWLAGPRLATAGVALSLLLVASTALLLMSRPASDEQRASMAQGGMAGFVAVAPRERWERLHDEGGAAWVVASEVQQQRLAQWGLPYDPARAADPVRAELLMRGSGEVLAVRVLY